MDLNSPIYREKYLKYKNKYLELKKLEENQTAGMFSRMLSSASSGLAKATGTDPQSKYNKSVMDLYNLQVTDVQNLGTELVKGLPSAQQKTITKVVYDMIANSIMGYGPISKAISAITGTHDSKGPIEGVKVPLPEDKLKEILLEQVKSSDLMSYARPVLEESLMTLHTEVMDQVKTVEVKDANKTANAITLKNLNDQLVVEKLCNQMGLEVSACDKKKIDAAKSAFKELETINKNKTAHNNSAALFEKTRNNAQLAMDKFATDLYKEANDSEPESPMVNTTLKGLEDLISAKEKKSLEALRTSLKLPGDKSAGLTKESLIEAFSKPDYHVPNVESAPKSPASPKAASEVPVVVQK